MKVCSKHWIAAVLAFAVAMPGVSSAALDSDMDGVADDHDECPQTPAKTAVDKRGCPLITDQDHDGVADAVDDCPATSPGAVVDAHGCALDEDGDGVADGIDQCPHTSKGISVDPKGCPMDKVAKVKPVVSPKKRASRAAVPPPPPMVTEAESALRSSTSPDPSHPPPVTSAMPVSEPLKPVAVAGPVALVDPKSEELPVVSKQATPSPAQEPAKPTVRQALSKLTAAKPTAAPVAKPKPGSVPAVAAAPTTVLTVALAPVPVVAEAAAPAPAPESKPSPAPVPAEPTAPVKEPKPSTTSIIAKTPALVPEPKPISAPVETAPQPVELPRFVVISFSAGSASLSADSLRKLNQLGVGLPAKPSFKLQIQAHANSVKDGRWPDDLAQQRADIVRVYLDAQGVAKSRMTLSTHVDASTSAEEERDNRRVDIQLAE